MRKLASLMVLVTILTIAGTFFHSVTDASSATSYTWTINSKGRWTKTQDAYLPELTLLELDLNEPEDLFVDKNNVLYIADTGNKRIVQYNIDKNQLEAVIEHKEFATPKGIYVTDDGNLYVADSKAEAIFRFDENGHFIESFERPTDIAFGDTPYNPARVAVDSKKNMFIIGEGVLNGVIHISSGGQFLGYFASNKVTLDLVEELQNFFFTDEQLDNLGSRVPLTMTNVYVDQENIVYSTTMGSEATNRVAKHNTAGKNVFNNVRGDDELIDLYVDPSGIIYTASLRGVIYVYSPDGEFIHSFGGFFGEEDISGLFTDLGSIAVDKNGKIWAADSSTSYIQSFVPTDYALTIYDALNAFKTGEYDRAEDLWLKVLTKNQMLRLAHEGIGKVYLYTERYEEAMKHLEIADNKYYYSQAYWEVRNVWLQKNLAVIITGFVVFLMVYQILKVIDRKKGIFNGYRHLKKKIRQHRLADDILFMFDFLRHPMDSFYDLKIEKKGSYLSATIWYVVLFGLYMHSTFGRDFLFTPVPLEDLDFMALIIGFNVILLLFMVTNYLVSSIQDGDGTLGKIYKLVVYSTGPMILSIVSITILSYVLSYNEVFLIDLINLIGPVWTLILLILGLQEIHQYTTREAIKSILISIGFMLIIAIMILIVMIMGEQLYDFFEALFREVLRNVTS